MPPRSDRAPTSAPPADMPDDAARGRDGVPVDAAEPRPPVATPSFADLPVAGLTRRRIGYLLGAVIAAWIVVLFARQVGDASAASARAEDLAAANAALTADVRALERELELIRRQAYVVQQARAYRLGRDREVPFALDSGAPPLGADAPGTVSMRLGSEEIRRSPLDAWLELLFGPDR